MNSDSPQPGMRNLLRDLVNDIGGESVLFSILREFYQRMSEDILIGFFFDGRDLDRISHMQGEFILNAAGLRSKFEGKGPSTAHIALPPILAGHFDRRLVILREVLMDRGLKPSLVEFWISFEDSFRKIVVHS